MTKEIAVSVVIPALNVARVIAEQLDALAQQVEAPSFEVVVADNGSTDGTFRVVEEFVAPYPLRIVDASQRKGASHARNIGAAAARAEVLAFCDSDDLVEPEWLARLVAARADDPGAVVAGALHHDRFNDPDVRHAYTLRPDPRSVGAYPVTAAPGPFAGHLPTVPGGNFLIDRADYMAVGGMDCSYPGGSEETDFVWRVQQTGVAVVSAPGAIVHYRLRSSARAMFRQQRIQQNAKVLLWMRFRSAGMQGPSWKFSTLAIIRLVIEAPVKIWSRRGRLYLGRWLGGHIGAVIGMIIFRVLHRVPHRILMDEASVAD